MVQGNIPLYCLMFDDDVRSCQTNVDDSFFIFKCHNIKTSQQVTTFSFRISMCVYEAITITTNVKIKMLTRVVFKSHMFPHNIPNVG